MKTKILALWMLLGLGLFVVAACSGDDAVCGNGIVEAGEECDDDTEACDKCMIKQGWECEDGDCYRVELCDNGIDDDENGLVDCDDPGCDTDPACITGCKSQSECSWTGGATEICTEGICRTVATFDDDGKVITGEVGVFNQFDTTRTRVNTIKSYLMEYFHPAIPGSSEKLDCEFLAEAARSGTLDTLELNRIRVAPRIFPSDSRDSYLLRDNGVLVTSDTKWLMLTRYFEGKFSEDSATRVTGRMLAFSCVEELEVFPGEWDPSTQVPVDVQPGCYDDEHCAEGWECMKAVGLCAYQQCDPPCDARGFTCRQDANGEPKCLPKCHENRPCEPGYRCDETPGWEPACYEL